MKPPPFSVAGPCILFCCAVTGCDVQFFDLGEPDTSSQVTSADVVPRYFHRASLLDDGRVMVTGGLTARAIPPGLATVDTISFFDPATGEFLSAFQPGDPDAPGVTPRLHLARSSHTQTTLADGRVLITGGNTAAEGLQPGSPTATCEIFDPATGIVSPLPEMNEARSFHTATLLGTGRVVVAGESTWQVFDPANDTWSAAAPLARARRRHAAVLLPGSFLVADSARDGSELFDAVLLIGGLASGTTIELVDPPNTMLYDARLPVGVFDLAAALLPNGRLLIAGGQRVDSGDTVSDTMLFHPLSGELTALDPPPGLDGGFGDHVMVPFWRHVVVFGGEQEVGDTDTELRRALVFDSQSLTWTGELTMHFTHDDFPVVKLDETRAVIIGGGVGVFGVPVPTANVEMFTWQGLGD